SCSLYLRPHPSRTLDYLSSFLDIHKKALPGVSAKLDSGPACICTNRSSSLLTSEIQSQAQNLLRNRCQTPERLKERASALRLIACRHPGLQRFRLPEQKQNEGIRNVDNKKAFPPCLRHRCDHRPACLPDQHQRSRN